MQSKVDQSLLALKVLETTRESVLVTDEGGAVVYANPAAERLFGGPLVGTHTTDLLHYSRVEKARVVETLLKSLDESKQWVGELSHHRLDGSVFLTLAEISAFACDGKDFWLYLEQDITQLRLKEDLVAEQEKTLWNSSRLSVLGEMASGIAHEINNPLTVINGKAEAIRSMVEGGKVDVGAVVRDTKKIEETVVSISRVIGGLRSFGREGEEAFELVPLAAILKDTLDFCRSRLLAHGINVQVSQLPERLQVECQRHQLSEALLNLVLNAHDAVEHEETKWIRIEARVQGSILEISVTDSGKGIPEKMRPRIFDPFFSSKDVGRGKGLGLSVAYGIVQRHQGSLTLATDKPHTSFVIRLPRRRLASAA